MESCKITDTELNLHLAALVVELVNRRKELGITQQELASMTGISRASVSNFENLSAMPKLETIIKIATVLGLELTIR